MKHRVYVQPAPTHSWGKGRRPHRRLIHDDFLATAELANFCITHIGASRHTRRN